MKFFDLINVNCNYLKQLCYRNMDLGVPSGKITFVYTPEVYYFVSRAP